MSSFLPVIYYSFIVVGIILFFVSLFIDKESNALISITSYSCLTSGILLIMASSFNEFKDRIKSLWDFFLIFKMILAPFAVVLLILGYLLYLTIKYQKKITSGNITSNYYILNSLTVMLVCLQMGILDNAMNTSTYKETKIIPSINNGLINLIGAINVILVVTLGNILKYFSTDG